MHTASASRRDAVGDYAGAGLCGVMAMECFVTPQGLLINELAPVCITAVTGHKTVPASASLSSSAGDYRSAVTATSGE